ncbi:antitoxin [Betaproteobacteria bacterium]|nr:antitoxin [Betaproteobacteria bacterium]GHU40340.1 antitoxin [Betaproteobacteria bacterium]
MAQGTTTSVSLDQHFSEFIGAQVATGRYDSASDVMCAGLRLLEEHEARRNALQEALIVGEESGFPDAFDEAEFLNRMRTQHGVARGK